MKFGEMVGVRCCTHLGDLGKMLGFIPEAMGSLEEH